MGDYPNHMARLWILLHPESWIRTSGLVELNPHLTPNLGFEILGLTLARVLPFELIGPATIAVCLLMFLSGSLLIARAIAPTQWGYGVFAGLFAWHSGLQAGFLSYSLAMGMFLVVFGCWLHWIRSGDVWWAIIASLLGAPLALIHATGPVLLGITAGSVLLYRLLSDRTGLITSMLQALPIAPACIVFLLLQRPSPPGIGHPFAWNSFGGKVAALSSWARTYDVPFDVAWVIALAIVIWLIVRRAVVPRWDAEMLAASAGLWLVSLAAPVAIMTGSGVDRRFVPAAFLLLALSVVPALVSAQPRMLAPLAALLLARQGEIAYRWHQYSNETATVVTLLETLPANAMLLQCNAEDDLSAQAEKRRMVFRHVGLFVTQLKGGVTSSLFGFETQQPIIVDHERLNRAAGAVSGSCREPSWPYLLVEDGAPTVINSRYTRMATTGKWSLWRRDG